MIENIELLAFVRENLALARTIVVKNEDLAILDNQLMLNFSHIDSGTDKSKWRYYLNLNGEYHFTDVVMEVKSLDDNEIIEFTKQNLESHPATKKAYRLGGYYFSRLVAQYPQQMELIQGIINPIPPEESIPAKNYQILRYTKEYVEWNEFQLIPQLQKFIDQTVYQSFNTEYKYTDDLIHPTLIGHLSEGIFKFLLECRFEHRYSRNAHSFYIWSYLQSKGISPIYKDLLNNKQTMWLFRNIDYVLRNLGKSGTFKELIDILLTERSIPLSKFDLIQSTETMSDDLHSEPLFFSERLNLIETKGLGQQSNKISLIMLKEIPESLDNEINYEKFLPITTEESTYGEQTTYPIKILDSELVDTTNRKSETFFNVLNNELIYLIGKNLYNINLDIEDPLTGVHQRVSTKDAIVLWHHLLNKYNGAECKNIPSFFYKDVLKITPPTIDVLQSVGSKPFLSKAWCQDVLNTYIPQIKIVSPSIFYENSLAIFHLKWAHTKMYSRWRSIGYYSQRKNAISTLYETGFVKLTDKKTYSDFLLQYEFDFSNYTKEDYFSLMWEIWRKITGWDQFSHITLAQIQDGMIGLMKFLSSYSVQYIYQTTMEEGWYEGGLDLMTENPGLLNPNGEGQIELESDVESNRLPVHHRVVMSAEEEESFYLDNRLHSGTLETEMMLMGKVYETPRLYPVELPDTDKDNGFYGMQVMDLSQKFRLYQGSLPYDLEDFIPKKVSTASDLTLREMIVDVFEGVKKVGPYTAIGVSIVNNYGLDNKIVAEDVDGAPYAKIASMEEISINGEPSNRYFIGFVPNLVGDHLIKIDIIIQHDETGELINIRFGYDTFTKKNTWMASFEIPETVTINSDFIITPTITGLDLTNETIIKEQYTVFPEIEEYLEINDNNGVITGKFLKSGWPEELPIMYLLIAFKNGVDTLANYHYYFIKGLIPSDRYYDPLEDEKFNPKATYFEADINAITMERFTVAAERNGWEAVNLYLKPNDDGSYPTDLIKTDYAGIRNYLTPKLSERKFFDTTTNGETTRTFEWLYAVAKTNVQLTLILELQNQDGDVVYREFTYSPMVLDHGAMVTFDILPEEGFKFGVLYSKVSALTVVGLSENITLIGGNTPTLLPNQIQYTTISYVKDQEIKGNKVYGYTIRPTRLLKEDMKWAAQVEGRTLAQNGTTLRLFPYGIITIKTTDVIDYDSVARKDFRIGVWTSTTIMAHAIVPARWIISDTDNGWQAESFEITKIGGKLPEFIATTLPGTTVSNKVTGFDPVIKMGIGYDGGKKIQDGYHRWFTLYILADRDYLNGTVRELDIPITAKVRSKYTGKTSSIQFTIRNRFSGAMFTSTRSPDMLQPSMSNHVVPTWSGIPLTAFGTNVERLSSEGIFIGDDRYLGGRNYKEGTTCVWNDDQTADITLPTAPITTGEGILIYNKQVYRSSDNRYIGTSLQDVVYFPYIQYSAKEIPQVPTPTLEDFDFTLIGGVDFFKGARSTYNTLYDGVKIYNYKWVIKSIDLEILGTAEQNDHIIMEIDGTDISNRAYVSGTQGNPILNPPKGKEKYNSAYVGFIPAKTGKQTFGVLVTIVNQLVTTMDPRTYRFEFEIDVKEQEGEVIFSESYPDPWWLIGKETYFMTDVINYSGTAASKRLAFATINNGNSTLAYARPLSHSLLGSGLALGVTVRSRFTTDSVRAVVGHSVYLTGYASADPRRERIYFNTLPIKPDHIYSTGDLNLTTIGFNPDIAFRYLKINQSYTERYSYNIDTYGWYVKTIRIRENSSWMNHFITYDGVTVKNTDLFNNTNQGVKIDKTISAPTGKYFYLPTYGGRVTGYFDAVIDITLASNHQARGASLTLTYTSSKGFTETDGKLTLDYDKLYIGEKNALTGGMVNIPTTDSKAGLAKTSTKAIAIGSNTNQLSLTADPYSVTVNEKYNPENNNGFMLAAITAYKSEEAGTTLDSTTAYRTYLGTQIIPKDDIIVRPIIPTKDDFNMVVLPSKLYQGVSCTIGFMYSVDTDGWECENKGLSVYGTSQASDIMISALGGITINNNLVHGFGTEKFIPEDAPEETKAYRYGYITFIPAHSGEQTLNVKLNAICSANSALNFTLDIPITITVKEKEGRLKYLDNQTLRYLIGGKYSKYVEYVDHPSDVVYYRLDGEIVPKENEGYLSIKALNNYNSHYLQTSVIKDFNGIDRSFLVITLLSFIDTGTGNTDRRLAMNDISRITITVDQIYGK